MDWRLPSIGGSPPPLLTPSEGKVREGPSTHTLYADIDAMLAPATLSALAGVPVHSLQLRALKPDFAKSGSQVYRVATNNGAGPTFFLKRVSLAWDWLMRATEDTRCRSVTLWERGVFDRMPPEIEHATVACARDGEGWAILMRDVHTALVPFARFSVAENERFLDAMAALHATFFEARDLSDPALGLCSVRHAYTMFSPATGYREAGGGDEIPQRILEGWEVALAMVDADVAYILRRLLDDPTPLCAALARYPHTLIHGDWRHANQGLLVGPRTRTVLLDWQLAAWAPPAVEMGRYLGANSSLLPLPKDVIIVMYRHKLAQRLGRRFDMRWWRPQIELGLLGGFLQDGWAIALKATTWRVGADARDRWRQDLQWGSAKVRLGVRWL